MRQPEVVAETLAGGSGEGHSRLQGRAGAMTVAPPPPSMAAPLRRFLFGQQQRPAREIRQPPRRVIQSRLCHNISPPFSSGMIDQAFEAFGIRA